MKRTVITEWRHTYLSARRGGWSRRRAAALLLRELAKGLRGLPATVREAVAAR